MSVATGGARPWQIGTRGRQNDVNKDFVVHRQNPCDKFAPSADIAGRGMARTAAKRRCSVPARSILGAATFHAKIAGFPQKDIGGRNGGVLDAAAQVLAETGKLLNCGEMMMRILKHGLWTTEGNPFPFFLAYGPTLCLLLR